MTQTIAVLLVAPGLPPMRVEVDYAHSWRTWYALISPRTHTFAVLRLTDHLELLCDELGPQHGLPINCRIPARAPQIGEVDFVVERPSPDGRPLMKPNEPGIGYHEIAGTFLIQRRRGPGVVSVTEKDIAWAEKMFAVNPR